MAAPEFAVAETAGTRVAFNDEGIALVDGKPFFPIGVFTYQIDDNVLAELQKVRCNTVLHGFNPDQLDLLRDHNLMAVCETSEAWTKAATHHPALLAWYLTDEPENRGVTALGERKRYLDLKQLDPNHPIGLCHTSFEALAQFKDACDFTMTDIYPITPQRDKNIMGVSIMMDEARRIHGAGWPQWTFIQTFGGREADQGVWAVPTPRELRFMVYQALVHRATGILYFSYWPQGAETWNSLVPLNDELHALVPRLVAPGVEGMLVADSAGVRVRVRASKSGDAGVIIAINTTQQPVKKAIQLGDLAQRLSVPLEGRMADPSARHEISERLMLTTFTYTRGTEYTGKDSVGRTQLTARRSYPAAFSGVHYWPRRFKRRRPSHRIMRTGSRLGPR